MKVIQRMVSTLIGRPLATIAWWLSKGRWKRGQKDDQKQKNKGRKQRKERRWRGFWTIFCWLNPRSQSVFLCEALRESLKKRPWETESRSLKACAPLRLKPHCFSSTRWYFLSVGLLGDSCCMLISCRDPEHLLKYLKQKLDFIITLFSSK